MPHRYIKSVLDINISDGWISTRNENSHGETQHAHLESLCRRNTPRRPVERASGPEGGAISSTLAFLSPVRDPQDPREPMVVTMKMGASPASSPATSPSGRRRGSPNPFLAPEETPWGIPGKPHIVTKEEANKEDEQAVQEKETFRKKLLAEEKRQAKAKVEKQGAEFTTFKTLQEARQEKERRRQRHSKEQRDQLHQRFLEGEAQQAFVRNPHLDFCSSVSYTQPRTSSPKSRRPPSMNSGRDSRDSFRSMASDQW